MPSLATISRSLVKCIHFDLVSQKILFNHFTHSFNLIKQQKLMSVPHFLVLNKVQNIRQYNIEANRGLKVNLLIFYYANYSEKRKYENLFCDEYM